MSIRFTVEANLLILIQHKPNNDKFMDHCRAVADHAAKALEYENLTPRKRLCAELAALLHDLDNKQYFPESTNNQNTRSLLRTVITIDNLDDFIEEVVALINLMYCDNEEASRWMYISRDCDCLETLNHRISISKTLHGLATERAYSVEEVSRIATPERFNNYLTTQRSNSVIDHCYDRLLHLAQPGILKSQNAYIITEANKRVDTIKQAIVSYWLNLNKA